MPTAMTARHLIAGLIAAASISPALAQDSVKVFLLAGQSNMVGHGRVEIGNGGVLGGVGSLRYQTVNNPAKYGHLVDGDNNWVVRDDAWVWHNNDGQERGPLTTEFGASNINIGPEYGFGFQVADFYDEPVLLVKTAWGGKSLGNDFLPPSAAAYPEPNAAGDTGYYYKLMIETYNDVVANLDTRFPALAGKTVDLEGVVWFQGYNDRFDNNFANSYEDNLAHLINDLRTDLGKPGLPFVVGATGNGGFTASGNSLKIIEAQAAVADPAKHPEFVGNVGFVETRGFWRDTGVSPTTAGHHWNANGESYYLIGEGLGQEMLTLVPEPTSLAVLLGASLVLGGRRRRR